MSTPKRRKGAPSGQHIWIGEEASAEQKDLAMHSPLLQDLLDQIKAGRFSKKSRFVFLAEQEDAGEIFLVLIQRKTKNPANPTPELHIEELNLHLRDFLNGRIPVAWLQLKSGKGGEIFASGGKVAVAPGQSLSILLDQLDKARQGKPPLQQRE